MGMHKQFCWNSTKGMHISKVDRSCEIQIQIYQSSLMEMEAIIKPINEIYNPLVDFIVFFDKYLIVLHNFYHKKKLRLIFLNYSMPVKKTPKVSDPSNPHHRKTKNRKSKQKSNSIDALSKNQISFFKAKYLTLVTEIFVNYAKDKMRYKKIGASIKELIAADIALQYLEKHCMQLTFQNAICESLNDLKRKFTDIWIARKLQIRGKRDIIHGLVDAKKSNRFNIGFHGAVGSKNSSTNNISNEDTNNQNQKTNKISKNKSSDFIKPLSVRAIEKNDDHSVPKNASANSSPKLLKRRKKKNNSQQQYQENEKDSPDQSKSIKGSKKNSKILFSDDEPPQNQQKNSLKKKKRTKKDDNDSINVNIRDENRIKSQRDEFQIIEKPNKKSKVNMVINNQNQRDIDDNDNGNDINSNENSDHFNEDIDLNELPPPLGTDSSDDNEELFDMNDQYNYNNGVTEQKKNDNFYKVFDYNDDNDDIIHNDNQNKRLYPNNSRFTEKNDRYNNRFNNRNNNYGNRFDDKDDDFDDRPDYKNKHFDAQNDNFNDKLDGKLDNFENDYKNDNFDFKNPNNDIGIKKDSKGGRTRVKSIGSHTHVHTNSGHNSNNVNKTKIKPKNNLNEISHFYTYTYEEEDEYSESTQYEYPTHIYEYEDFDEEEENGVKKMSLNSNNYNKSNHLNKSNKPAHEDSLITGEIEIQTQEIDILNPILPPSNNNYSIEKGKKSKNKISNADNSYPSSGSPQNHSTSSNSLHEQKIKLTLQQNVEMIQDLPQEEKKQTKPKTKSKSRENSQIQEEAPTTIIENQLIFETFHTVDVQPNLELQRIFKQRKGNKQKQKESANNDSAQNNNNNNCEQIYFPLQNNANANKKVQQQLEPVQKKTTNSENEIKTPQNPINIHIKIVEAVIFKDSGFETNIFKVRIKLQSAREFAETRESTPSAIQQFPDSNQLIAHHLWDEAFKIFCNTIENEEINVSVLALRNKNKTKQKTFDVVSTAKIGLKSFVIDEISDVWINMKNIGRIHLLVCIKNFNPNDDDDLYNEEEEEEEEEAEMSDNGNDNDNGDEEESENNQ